MAFPHFEAVLRIVNPNIRQTRARVDEIEVV
jgi:hypothetical protein